MKHSILPIFCLILLFSPCISSGAMELELLGGVNFLTYHPKREIAHSDPGASNPKFQAYPYGFGKLSLRGDISDSMTFDVSAERDNIFSNNVRFTLFNRTDNFRFEFGPFIGMGDTLETPTLGIIGSIEITFPGIAFLSLGGSSTLGSTFDFTSNNFQESAEVKLGFWLPNLILTASASTRSLSRYQQDPQVAGNFSTIRNMLTRFQASFDFFAKNLPVSIRIDGGYEIYSRSYKSGNVEHIDRFNAWYVGADIGIQVSKPLKIKIGAEVPLFYSTEVPMIKPDFFWNIFKASAGFVYTFF